MWNLGPGNYSLLYSTAARFLTSVTLQCILKEFRYACDDELDYVTQTSDIVFV